MERRKPKPLGPRRPVRVRILDGPFVRVLLLAALAVVATVWATWRFYTRPRAPMVVPGPSSTGPDELPVPEIIPELPADGGP